VALGSEYGAVDRNWLDRKDLEGCRYGTSELASARFDKFNNMEKKDILFEHNSS
jgi:hypothetical protein